MTPAYLFAAYIQAKGEYGVMNEYKNYLPEELAA